MKDSKSLIILNKNFKLKSKIYTQIFFFIFFLFGMDEILKQLPKPLIDLSPSGSSQFRHYTGYERLCSLEEANGWEDFDPEAKRLVITHSGSKKYRELRSILMQFSENRILVIKETRNDMKTLVQESVRQYKEVDMVNFHIPKFSFVGEDGKTWTVCR